VGEVGRNNKLFPDGNLELFLVPPDLPTSLLPLKEAYRTATDAVRRASRTACG